MDNNVNPEKQAKTAKKGPTPFMVGIGIFILFGVLVLSTLDFRAIFARSSSKPRRKRPRPSRRCPPNRKPAPA